MSGPIDILMSHVSLKVYFQSIHVQKSIFYKIYTNFTEKILKTWTVRVLKAWSEKHSKKFHGGFQKTIQLCTVLSKKFICRFQNVCCVCDVFES